MAIKVKCPWCDKTFTDPPLSGIQKADEIKIKHMKKQHEEKWTQYKDIIAIWYNKIRSEQNLSGKTILTLSRIYNELGTIKGETHKISEKIVNDYNPEELRKMSYEELENVISQYQYY